MISPAYRRAESGSFEPGVREDRYEQALIDLINQVRNGQVTPAASAPKSNGSTSST